MQCSGDAENDIEGCSTQPSKPISPSQACAANTGVQRPLGNEQPPLGAKGAVAKTVTVASGLTIAETDARAIVTPKRSVGNTPQPGCMTVLSMFVAVNLAIVERPSRFVVLDANPIVKAVGVVSLTVQGAAKIQSE
ncbi:MAG: hypothetical protein Q9190_001720 [Brigantiaea leucoxantha]